MKTYSQTGTNNNQSRPYPKSARVKWTWIHFTVIALSTLVIWTIYCFHTSASASPLRTILSIVGLNIDILGVTFASLKTPFYGSFMNGGEVEDMRMRAEAPWFQLGMLLIAIGCVIQAIAIQL